MVQLVYDIFYELMRDTKLVRYMFIACSVFAFCVLVAQYTYFYTKVMLDHEVKKLTQYIRPLIMFGIVIVWPNLYYIMQGIIDTIGLSLDASMEKELNALTSKMGKIVLKQLTDDEIEVSLFNVSIMDLMFGMFKWMLSMLNMLVDIVVAVYININDMVLMIVAPVALALSIVDAFKDAFLQWIKLFVLYKLLGVFLLVGDIFGITLFDKATTLTAAFFGVASNDLLSAGAAVGTVVVYIIALVVSIAFKIMFIFVIYRYLSAMLGVSSMGVGGAVAGGGRVIAEGVKALTTKGASLGASAAGAAKK